MADSPLTDEGFPVAGKWWRDELKGCESTQVLEPSRRNKEIWEKRVIFPYSLDNKTFAFGGLEIPMIPPYDVSKIEPNIRAKSYTRYIEEQNQLKGEVSDEEHVIFLILWLSQHVFCTRSLQVAKMFLPMAIQLHEGQQFGIGKLIMGCLYESMRSVCENIKKIGDGSTFLGSGTFWLLQLWLNATFRVEMDSFLLDLHNEEVAKRQIEGVRLARLIPRTRGLTHQQLFLQYFEALLGLKEFKVRFAPFANSQIGPSWFIHPFPPFPKSEEYQNAVWSAFLTPTVISCQFGLKSTEFGLVGYFPNFVSRQFGLTQLLPKTIYLHERDICLGYYGMTEPQFYALLKKFEGLEYELTPFHFELSHAHTIDFSRWWNLHYESQMVDVVVLRSAIEAGFNAQAIRKIKSTLNARGSRSKAESNSLAKPPFPPVKTEPGATTRKRAATAEAGGPSKKATPMETVVIDDDDVIEVEEKQSTPMPKASDDNSRLELELRRKRKHEQPAPILEENKTTPSEKEEKKKKKKKKKKKDKNSKGKESPSQDGAPTEDVSIPEQVSHPGEEQTEKKKKKKDKKSHSLSDPSVTNTSKSNPDLDEELKKQETSVNPDLTPRKTPAPHSPKNTNLGQVIPQFVCGPSSTVLVPEISPDSIVKTVVSELNQQLEHAGEGELSPMTKTIEDTGIPIQEVVSTLSETSPPKVSTGVDLTAEAGSSKAGEIKNLDNSLRETLSTIPEQTTPKNSNEVEPKVVDISSKAKELDFNRAEGATAENVDNQASKDKDSASDAAHTQLNLFVEDTTAAQTNPDPPLNQKPVIEPSRPLGEDNAEVVKVAENAEEDLSNQGEHSSTRDHHSSKLGNKDAMYEDIDDFLNSSAGYARTARTGDSIEDDGTSVSKPTSDLFLPYHILQSVKNLTPEETLDTLLKTYGSEVPIAEEDKQKLEKELKDLELHFQKTIIEGDMLSYVDQHSVVYFNLKSLFTKLQTHPIPEALSFQVTQAENLLEQYARSLQHFNRLTTDLNKQIETRVKHFDLATQGNAKVNALKVASASAFLQISACEDNIARWKSEIRELESKIGQEEEKKKQLEAQAVEVPKATIEEKAKIGIHHYSEALRAGVEVDRLTGENNVVQRRLAHLKSLYDQFRQAHI
ncbi:hypothetical protein TSUD_257520 [Trifolium subterraneum]|uniref:Aminotransferase-like plant mobile domain-containing protein n=1 Tax=Trifolium subterraneum TaxID=3900 RepID=A0A2Z6M2E3_TRISU|nr:hypothetical protein TSUD_257520 [Trifolium subterraneum]